jgi:hypothetical protein
MQSVLGKRKRNPSSSIPDPSKPYRYQAVAEYIISLQTKAMVSCTQCINNGVECYYSREQSVKCAECILKHRKCDGTFSLEELRKVGELKKTEQKKRRQKLGQIAKLRAALAEAENEQHQIEESLAELDDRTDRMLKREMLALGVFDKLPDEQEIALGDGDMSWFDEGLHMHQIDWDEVLQPASSS